jgi:hypothetical protein
MNRLLILLFMVGWAFYIVQAPRTADAVQSEQNAKASGKATPGQQAVKQSKIQPIARAAVRSPHAITPDEPPQKAAMSSGASPPTHPAENSESQPSSSQPVASDPTFEPGAKKSGWISMAYLAPAERENEFESTASAQAEQPQSTPAARPKQPPKTAKPKPPKPAPKVSQLPPTYAELPADREFVPPRRGGLFGLFWKRRLTAEQFSHRPSP